MSRKVSTSELAFEIEKELRNYKNLAADEMKKAVKKAGRTAKSDISQGAPERSGGYAKSWKVKTTFEDSMAISVIVHSPTHYNIAHLLENGHVKRGGGRVRAIPHIKPAEDHARNELVKDIEKALKG